MIASNSNSSSFLNLIVYAQKKWLSSRPISPEENASSEEELKILSRTIGVNRTCTQRWWSHEFPQHGNGFWNRNFLCRLISVIVFPFFFLFSCRIFSQPHQSIIFPSSHHKFVKKRTRTWTDPFLSDFKLVFSFLHLSSLYYTIYLVLAITLPNHWTYSFTRDFSDCFSL